MKDIFLLFLVLGFLHLQIMCLNLFFQQMVIEMLIN